MNVKTLLKGAGLGAALMYVFDPERGRRRRARLLDQYDHAVHSLEDFVSKAQRDMSNRFAGLTHEAAAMCRPGDADDAVIVDRVRSKLGRYVSHPRAIDVESHDGRIILSGTVLKDEVKDLMKAVSGVRGVKEVENHLDAHAEPSDISSLQGGKSPSGETYDIARNNWIAQNNWIVQNNWSPATRLLAQTVGAALMGNCLVKRNLSSTLLGAAGFALFLRGATNRKIGQLVGAEVCPQATKFQRTVIIHAPVEKVWDFITDFEQVGRFLPNVKTVQNLGDDRYRWTLALPGGREVNINERITESTANERLSWESIANHPVSYMGTVGLQREGDNATRVNVHFEYAPSGGAVADWAARFVGVDPETKFHDAMIRIKTYLETGHPPRDLQKVSTQSDQET